MAFGPGSNRASLRMTMVSRISNAGPEAKAEARKRGARRAVNHRGRAARPLYRNAVTVWMLTAHGMDRMMTGLIHAGGATPFRSALRVVKAMTALSPR